MLPQTLFRSLNLSNDSSIGLLFGVYKDSILFPQANQTNEQFQIASSVISANVIGYDEDIYDL